MRVSVNHLAMAYLDGDHRINIFDGVSLDVHAGCSVAIVGESGVGKTTLLNLIGGLEKPVSGDVVIDGKSLVTDFRSPSDLAPYRGEKIGFIFQFFHLLSEFDAIENVAMPLLVRGMSFRSASGRAKECLERVGLGHRLTHRPSMLSGGEQQRVAIARALVGSPAVLLADEPTGNLDLKTGDTISRLLLELHKEEGNALIVVTHSKDLAERLDSIQELTANGLVKRK